MSGLIIKQKVNGVSFEKVIPFKDVSSFNLETKFVKKIGGERTYFHVYFYDNGEEVALTKILTEELKEQFNLLKEYAKTEMVKYTFADKTLFISRSSLDI